VTAAVLAAQMGFAWVSALSVFVYASGVAEPLLSRRAGQEVG